MEKKVLITGAAGFIGFHTARALKKRGDAVIGYDNFNAYYSPDLKHERAALLQAEGISVIEGDLAEREKLAAVASEATHILHLAAQAGVRHARSAPDSYVESNLQGFLSLLEICRQRPQIPLIYASSSSVYGCNEKTPFSETDPTERPANLYAATKKANELMAFSYHHLYGIPVTGLRYFTVYGPWGRPDMAYYLFSEAITEGRPISLFNGGDMERDFTYIDDVVEGTLAALDLAAPCAVFNLGNNRTEKLMTLVELLEKHLGKEAVKQFEGPSAGEVHITSADITLAKTQLGFAPKVPLDEGIRRFADWYKARKTPAATTA